MMTLASKTNNSIIFQRNDQPSRICFYFENILNLLRVRACNGKQNKVIDKYKEPTRFREKKFTMHC